MYCVLYSKKANVIHELFKKKAKDLKPLTPSGADLAYGMHECILL
jgi:hypothetical protein